MNNNINSEIIIDNDFDYEGYQVVRGEFFAHLNEPAITLNDYKFNVNSACINKLPNVEYVQILVNPTEKKLAVKPCSENDRDSFLWRTANSKSVKKRPRRITCRAFFAKLFSLMDWNFDFKYKLMGKLIHSNGEYLFIFDLTSTEVYQKADPDSGKRKNLRIPVFPEEWKNQFGLPVEEHKKTFQVNIYDGYAVYEITEKKAECSSETQSKSNNIESQAINNGK